MKLRKLLDLASRLVDVYFLKFVPIDRRMDDFILAYYASDEGVESIEYAYNRRSGNGLGRVFRIVPKEGELKEYFSDAPLDDEWMVDKAALKDFEREVKKAEDALGKITDSDGAPKTLSDLFVLAPHVCRFHPVRIVPSGRENDEEILVHWRADDDFEGAEYTYIVHNGVDYRHVFHHIPREGEEYDPELISPNIPWSSTNWVVHNHSIESIKKRIDMVTELLAPIRESQEVK